MPTLTGKVQIHVSQSVTLDNLQAIIAQIAGLTGCRACGILGVDLQLTGDPVELQQIAKLPGVQSVTFGE
jgi:hypothetical protein